MHVVVTYEKITFVHEATSIVVCDFLDFNIFLGVKLALTNIISLNYLSDV